MNPHASPQYLPRFLFVLFVLFAVACGSQDGREAAANGEKDESPVITSDSPGTELDTFVSFSPDAVMGANIYVPVYSHIYQLNQGKTFNLTATLSIRNTDLLNPVNLKKVYYYDSKGELVHRYLDSAETISPLSSISFVVEEEDLRGGVGANFLVLWESERPVSKPVVEAVMISTSQQQGISFVSEGRVLQELERTDQ